jgi:hypothetical protein
MKHINGQRTEYTKGIAGKIVDRIVFSECDHDFDIEIRFRDGTSIHFGLIPRVTLEPELWNWKREGRTIRRYPLLTSPKKP